METLSTTAVARTKGKLVLNPDVPKQCGKIVMRGVHAFGQRFDVTGEGRMGGVGPAGSAG